MQHSIKPFPPFGALLYQLKALDIPIKFSPYIFIGQLAYQEAVKMNSGGQISLYLPESKYIQDYMWPIEDLSVILAETGYVPRHLMNLMAYSLINEGAKQVCLFDRDGMIEIFNH